MLEGGGGNDTATYIEFGTDVHVNLLTGTGWGGTAEGDALTGIENLTGSIFDDDLTGDDRDSGPTRPLHDPGNNRSLER